MKLAAILSAALMLVPAVALSEEAPVALSERPDILFAAPSLTLGGVGGLVGGVGFVYERVLSPRIAFTAGLQVDGSVSSYGNGGPGYSIGQHYGSLDVQVRPGLRFFLTEKAPSGLWVGPRLEGSYTLQRTSYSPGPALSFQRGGGVGVSALVGYSRVFASGFFLEAAAGAGIAYSVSHGGSPTGAFSLGPQSVDSSSVTVDGRFEVGLGYAF